MDQTKKCAPRSPRVLQPIKIDDIPQNPIKHLEVVSQKLLLAPSKFINSPTKIPIDISKKSKLNEFFTLAQLGRGSFGDVYLVRHQISKKLFAMKIFTKKQIFSQNLIKYAIAESNVISTI